MGKSLCHDGSKHMADPPGQVQLGDEMSEAPSGSVATELSQHTSPLSMIQTCLSALLNADSDGRLRFISSNCNCNNWVVIVCPQSLASISANPSSSLSLKNRDGVGDLGRLSIFCVMSSKALPNREGVGLRGRSATLLWSTSSI